MYTITTRLAMAITRASMATAGARGPSATAVTQVPASAAFPVMLLAVAFLILVVRVNRQLVSLVSQLVQLAAAASRTLILIALFAGGALVILLHL